MIRYSRRLLPTLVALALVPTVLLAQDDEDGPWTADGEIGASLFFGASEQTTLTLRSSASRENEMLEFSFGTGFAYGEGQNPSTEESFVNKRSWTAQTAVDYRPQATVSPFVFASAEGSFERQIDSRLSGGAGAKYRLVDSETAKLDVSLAALVERTDPRTAAEEDDVIDTKGRWSARLRAGREFSGGRTVFDLVTFYRPAFGDVDDYTVDLETSLAFSLTERVALKVSLVDTYDSLAESRGATSNNDGRFLVSLLASTG